MRIFISSKPSKSIWIKPMINSKVRRLAIYGNKLYYINRDTCEGVELIPIEESATYDELFYVGYNDPELIIDPTDDEIKEAQG